MTAFSIQTPEHNAHAPRTDLRQGFDTLAELIGQRLPDQSGAIMPGYDLRVREAYTAVGELAQAFERNQVLARHFERIRKTSTLIPLAREGEFYRTLEWLQIRLLGSYSQEA